MRQQVSAPTAGRIRHGEVFSVRYFSKHDQDLPFRSAPSLRSFLKRAQERVYGRTTQVVEIVFPIERARLYAGRRLVINQDVESKILIRIRVYDREGELVENYGYENLDVEARLADADFDPNNSSYNF